MNEERQNELIERIDTSIPTQKTIGNLYAKVLELQVKVNEIIDALNILTLPDEDTMDDGEEAVFISAAEVESNTKQKTKKR